MDPLDLLDQLERRWPPPLVRFRKFVRMFLLWLFHHDVPLAALSLEHARDFLASHRAVGAAPSTLQFDGLALHRFLRWGYHRKLWPRIPLKRDSWRQAAHQPIRRGPFHPYFHRLDALLRYEGLPNSNLLTAYCVHLRRHGFGCRQIRFILANIAAFLEFLRRQRKGLDDVSLGDLDTYFRQAPFILTNDHGKARRTYLLRFLTFALPHRAPIFRVPPRFQPTPDPFGDLGRDFLHFSAQHRGLKDTTRLAYRYHLRSFQAFLSSKNVRDPRRTLIHHVDAFFISRAVSCGPCTLKSILGAIRAFFHFLHLNGHTPSDLSSKIMPPSFFRKHLRPKYLSWDQVRNFLGSIDRSSTLGKRDYAMALLMATLGLRARELARLRVQDVDLPGCRLHLPERKNGSPDLLPLSKALASALRAYLDARPASTYDALFLSVRPPVKPIGLFVRDAVSIRMARHFHRPRSMRVYLLRHSFAKRLLDNGAPLHDIAAVMGHKSLSSTLVYTQVDTSRLRDVADNYATLLPTPPGFKPWPLP